MRRGRDPDPSAADELSGLAQERPLEGEPNRVQRATPRRFPALRRQAARGVPSDRTKARARARSACAGKLQGMTGREAAQESYRFDELGSLQFERLCLELLQLFTDLSPAEWHGIPSGRARVLPEGVPVPGGGRTLPGPAVASVVWIRPETSEAASLRLGAAVQELVHEWSAVAVRSLLLLTNAKPDGSELAVADVEIAMLGPDELTLLVASSWPLRLRVPSVLGVGALEQLAASESVARSTADLDAASELARVFVPTKTYAATLAVLAEHRFAALTGPPEMGKTAIARMIGLAALSGGWEMHECIRPDELWARFARERSQVFIADDAFGSTEYRPERRSAGRWSLTACSGRWMSVTG
jgi:hypothetical protein